MVMAEANCTHAYICVTYINATIISRYSRDAFTANPNVLAVLKLRSFAESTHPLTALTLLGYYHVKFTKTNSSRIGQHLTKCMTGTSGFDILK